jgi:hypothetical protein
VADFLAGSASLTDPQAKAMVEKALEIDAVVRADVSRQIPLAP